MSSESMFDWVEQNCCCCNHDNNVIIGYRGGDAHVSGKGIKCTIVSCSNCGHIYPNPMPVLVDTNRAYKDADEYFVNNDPEERIKEITLILHQVEKRLGYKGKLLDVGSGRGELLYAAKKSGWEVQGVETSEEFADYSKKKYDIDVKNCSLATAEYPTEHFDVITLRMVMEHLYHPEKILEEINRLLKYDGLLWVNAPNELSLYNRIGNLYFRTLGKNWVTQLSPTFAPYHVQGFTKNSMRTLLLRTGFKLEYLDTFNEKLLLPTSGIKQCVEHYAASMINYVALLTNTATFMNVFARKISA